MSYEAAIASTGGDDGGKKNKSFNFKLIQK
jgi:hypothetical protein